MDKGELPREIIDENLQTDISWIKRLTQKEENVKEIVKEGEQITAVELVAHGTHSIGRVYVKETVKEIFLMIAQRSL